MDIVFFYIHIFPLIFLNIINNYEKIQNHFDYFLCFLDIIDHYKPILIKIDYFCNRFVFSSNGAAISRQWLSIEKPLSTMDFGVNGTLLTFNDKCNDSRDVEGVNFAKFEYNSLIRIISYAVIL